jgi:hypothetical protein
LTARPRTREDADVPAQTETISLGASFARALAAKDFASIAELMDAEIDFGALTPRRTWEAKDPGAVVTSVLREWFEDSDEILSLEHLETDAFADRERVGYRLRVRNPEGLFLVDQQAYITARDGRIAWMRVLCSGYRPLQ